jgi:hypothetical protein
MRHSTPAFLIVARRECARHTQEGLFRVNQLEEITPCAETDSPDCRGKEKLIRAEPPRQLLLSSLLLQHFQNLRIRVIELTHRFCEEETAYGPR